VIVLVTNHAAARFQQRHAPHLSLDVARRTIAESLPSAGKLSAKTWSGDEQWKLSEPPCVLVTKRRGDRRLHRGQVGPPCGSARRSAASTSAARCATERALVHANRQNAERETARLALRHAMRVLVHGFDREAALAAIASLEPAFVSPEFVGYGVES
jgi:ribosomal protein L16/L10AE